MKKEIHVFDYAGDICKELQKGILLTTKSGDEVNTMTIGWGMLAVEWNKPIFVALVRESRYTKQMLEENGEFTVNIPVGDINKKILGYCGTMSGRDVDKIKEMGLTLVEPVNISVPGIKELPLTLECKVIYKQKQDLDAIPAPLRERFYPELEKEVAPGEMRDYHIAYFGEIVAAYIIED